MTGTSKIRVLVVDDSVMFRSLLIKYLSEDPAIEVIGYAVNASDALVKIEQLKPDILTLDVEMPKISGIEFLKMLIPKNPIPVVMVSSLNMSVFDALSAGAIDFVRKPEMGSKENVDAFFLELKNIIKTGAKAKVRQFTASARPPARQLPLTGNSGSVVIALGASTGGTESTIVVIKDLPEDTPGMVIVQHMPPGFTKMYANRLKGICKMDVDEAVDGDEIKTGKILIAPGDKQMAVIKKGTGYAVRCYDAEKVSGHRPSVDVLFNSMAEQVKANAVGIILTGMGRDGADGLLKMRKAGAYTIGQDKETSVVYGMPMVAFDIGAVMTQSPLDRISVVLRDRLNIMVRRR